MTKKKNHKISKKAEISFLGEHTLGLIVAVLCIIVLIFIGVKIYNLFSEKSDLDKAESNLKLIQGEIELIKTSTTANVNGSIIIYSPKGWVLRTYNNNDFPQAECYGGKSCLCLCQDGTCTGVQKVCNGFIYSVEISSNYKDSGYVYSTVYPNSIGFLKAAEGLKIYSQNDKILIEQIQNG